MDYSWLHKDSMHSSHATVWLALLATIASTANCSKKGNQPCALCDAATVEQPGDAPGNVATEALPVRFDAELDVGVTDQAVALDKPLQADFGIPSAMDGAQESGRDAPWGEAAMPTAVSDAGVLMFNDFENGKADGWRAAAWSDAGNTDKDWSVFLGDTGYVYSEGSLDKIDWHISFAGWNAISDQIVESQMRVVEFYDLTPSYAAALFARYDPTADSGYFVSLRGDGSLIIRKRVHGKNASWGAAIDATIVPGKWYTVRLEVLGNTANAFLDGQFVYSVTDSDPLSSGTAALGTYGATLEVDRVLLAQP